MTTVDPAHPGAEAAKAPAPQSSRRPSLPSLTGARWWAAASVFLLHVLVFMPVYPFQKSELFEKIHAVVPMQLGSAGVTFFFVLSGFIIYWSNGGIRTAGEVGYYWLRRVVKIYPSHLVTAGLFLLVAAVPLTRTEAWLPNLLLIQTWTPHWTMISGLNVPSWSLVAEMLFYFSFPLVLPLVRMVRGPWIWAAVAVLYLIILGIHTGVYLLADGYKGTENFFVPRLWEGDASPMYEAHSSPAWFAQETIPVDQGYWLSYNFPLIRLPEFFLGVLAAKLVVEGRWRYAGTALPMLALGGSYLATWVVPVNFKMSALMLLPTAALFASLAVKDLTGRTGWNGSARMIWLGNISFAFYLVQFPVMAILNRWFIAGHQFGVLGWGAFALVAAAMSVAVAWLIYEFVDDPLMRATSRLKTWFVPSRARHRTSR